MLDTRVGIGLAFPAGVLHVIDDEPASSPIPARRNQTFILSALAHLLAVLAIANIVVRPPAIVVTAVPTMVSVGPVPRSIVFIARAGEGESRGGGGGGNRQTGPIRRAEGIGRDAITLRTATPIPTTGATDTAALPQLLLDARPLASGTANQLGLPVGGVSFGTSTGPGSGGGVGEGVGSGIGPGTGPGFGPGSGGGMGGGMYRPGGSVAPPRVLTQVKPTYTNEALEQRIQGTVVLELVVRADGHPTDIRVIRSLQASLDLQAIVAAREWRFEPGRLAGRPVDVQVLVAMDFSIR
jgi:periplasmic protein TonB